MGIKAVETKDCHDIHGLYKCKETSVHSCKGAHFSYFNHASCPWCPLKGTIRMSFNISDLQSSISVQN